MELVASCDRASPSFPEPHGKPTVHLGTLQPSQDIQEVSVPACLRGFLKTDMAGEQGRRERCCPGGVLPLDENTVSGFLEL